MKGQSNLYLIGLLEIQVIKHHQLDINLFNQSLKTKTLIARNTGFKYIWCDNNFAYGDGEQRWRANHFKLIEKRRPTQSS
jgi:hypothetical protein